MIKYNQKIHIALRLTVSLDTIIKRIKERSALEKRDDDSEEIAIKRYETYEKNIKPVIDFYKQSNLLKDINGESSIIEINNEISALIESIKG
jgi:adenylate kinase